MKGTTVGRHIGMQIQAIMAREMGPQGSAYLKTQCKEIGTTTEALSLRDLSQLSQRMTRSLRPVLGDEQANRIGKEILKFKIIKELEELGNDKDIPHRERKELEAYSRLGNISYTVGDWDDAIDYYDTVLRLSNKTGDKHKLAEAHRTLGHIYKRRTNWDDAIDHFETAKKISTTINHNMGVADSYRGLGYVFWRMGKYKKAREHIDRAIELAKNSREKGVLGVIYIESGLIFSDIGELEKAEIAYLSSISLLKDERDYQQLSRAYNNLGDLYLQKEMWKDAVEYFTCCKDTAETINHQMMMAWALFNTAEAQSKSGSPKEALDNCQKSLEILQHIDDQVGLCAVHRNFGLAHGLLRNWSESEKHFQKSDRILEDINSPFNVAHLYLEWGCMKKERGDVSGAREKLEHAVETFGVIGASKYAKKAENILSTL